MASIERRKNTRVKAGYEISYIHNNDYLVSFTKDISADGMFIYTKNPPKEGETIVITFSIEDLKDAKIEAKVVWVNKLKAMDDPGIGVKFINPSEDLKEAMLKVANRVAVIDK